MGYGLGGFPPAGGRLEHEGVGWKVHEVALKLAWGEEGCTAPKEVAGFCLTRPCRGLPLSLATCFPFPFPWPSSLQEAPLTRVVLLV